MAEKINIELTNLEGLILFEFIQRITSEKYKDVFTHDAEQRVLWDIECILEKSTRIPFNTDFKEEMKRIKNEYIEQREGL